MILQWKNVFFIKLDHLKPYNSIILNTFLFD